MDAETAILKARVALMWDHLFFGALITRLILVKDNRFPTMATDGRHLFYNEMWTLSLKKGELLFVLAHEVLHNALEHHIRRQLRDHDRWNEAADYAINGDLVEAKVGTMPKGGLRDERFTGLGVEEIYRVLDEEAPPPPPAGGGAGGENGSGDDQSPARDPGGCGSVIDACPQYDEAAIAEARAEMQTAVRQAAALAKAANAGTLPAGIQRIVDRLLAPRVNWREVLRRFVDESITRDFSWAKPNRRLLPARIYAPGLVSDGLQHLVVAIDTSGSIDEQMLIEFASEINGAFGDGGIDQVTIIYADACVNHVDTFMAGDEIRFNMHGGGGTDFRDTFRWIRENAPDASAVIYFTDMLTRHFGDEPPCPVLWAVRGDSRFYRSVCDKAPFGESLSLAA